ncbi:MAG: NAD(P)H-dependent oxidoreductase [Paracoccaceae bacterium]
MAELKLLTICGALRAASTNRLLVKEAVLAFGPASMVEANLRFPLFDEDIETGPGIPQEVQTLADQIAAADAVVISTPEYNKALPGVLKNALDWVSRTKGITWRGKAVAIISAADGRGGGDRSQFSLRLAMVPLMARVLPGPEVMVAHSREAFDEQGKLKDAHYVKALAELMALLRTEAARN